MEDFQNIPFYAKYQRFTIGKATDSYRLNISGYSGDEGDSLINHNGLPFSTKDNGNTVCAVRHQGAWWYNYCYHSNLNGLYVISSYSRTGIVWQTYRFYYPLKSTKMMIRRVPK